MSNKMAGFLEGYTRGFKARKSRLDIVPHESVGDIKFGMSQEEVSKILGEGEDYSRDYSRIGMGVQNRRYYPDRGTFVIYDDAGKVEAVEMLPESKARLEGKNIFKNKKKLQKLISDLRTDDYEFSSKGKGVAGMYGDDTNTVSSVLAHRKGYYDE